MKYIKNIFDAKITNNIKFPFAKSNYTRQKYKLIEYKEKDIYEYIISEENRDCSYKENE